MSVQDEVLANILAQPIGDGPEPAFTVADLQPPQEFLRRVAGRTIRSSYESRFRIVVRNGSGGPVSSATWRGPSRARPRADGAAIQVIDRRRTDQRPGDPTRGGKGRPVLRGFRAPLEPSAPAAGAPAEADEAQRRAAALIGTRLARDGLPATLAAVVESLGPGAVVDSADGGLGLLARAGFPTDLLGCFRLAGVAHGDPAGLARHAAERLLSGEPAPTLARRFADSARFEFAPSAPGFRAMSDAGDEPVGMLRLQLTGGGYWGGIGAGSGLDLARQLAAKAPDLKLVVSIQRQFLDEAAAEMARWPGDPARVTLIPQEATVSQWARDNGVPGSAGPGPVTLVPRFASRGEEGAIYVPGESAVAEGLLSAGLRVVQSPLLFQGGNLILVPDPASGRRILLVGEAEIARNTMLGLTPAQAAEALRAELGADRVEVLPAGAFHIDYEVSVRVVGSSVLAFVSDTAAAARLVLQAGLGTMERKRLNSAAARAALAALHAGRLGECLAAAGPAVYARAVGPGQWPESFAQAFSTGPSDSGTGNLQRFLLAMDMAASRSLRGQVPGADRHLAAYLTAMSQAEADRTALRERLAALGWTLVPIPSMGDGDRAINTLNGIHAPGRYFMPAYGGLYTSLDDAAAAAFHRAIGPGVKIVPILCGESQRRQGAVRCSVAAYPP